MERSQHLDREVAERQEKFAVLESTEGYASLSEKQRRFIKASLYVQARTEREKDFDKNLGEKYRESRRIISDLNCHTSILNLENGVILFMDPEEIPFRFYNAEYFNPSSLKEVESIIEKFGFPCIVNIGKWDPDPEVEEFRGDYHSFVVLGHYKDEIIVWDKEGFNSPFRLTNLRKEYSTYNDSDRFYWGFRRHGFWPKKLINHLSNKEGDVVHEVEP